MSRPRLLPLACLLACSERSEAPRPAPEAPPPPAPAAAAGRIEQPAPPPPRRGLAAAAAPVLSTPVPEGFVREDTLPGAASQAAVPWANLVGDAPLEAVVEFYARVLDPGVPGTGGMIAASSSDGGPGMVPCATSVTRLRKGCKGTTAECSEVECIRPALGGYLFEHQHPLPPGDPAASVNVRVARVGSRVRITIENESILERLGENPPEGDFPERPDLSGYENLEDIPAEYID